MNNLLYQNENGIIIQQIINLLTNITFDKTKKLNFVIQLLSLAPKISLILFSKYLVNKLDGLNNLGALLVKLVKLILYKRECYSVTKSKELGIYLSIASGKMINTSYTTLIDKDTDFIRIYNMRFLPNSQFYNQLMEESKAARTSLDKVYIPCNKLVIDSKNQIILSAIYPNQLYPSKNFKMLASIINSNIEKTKLTKYYQTIPILINGEPGLGKSKSLDYLAYNTTVKLIKKVDLTNFIGKNTTLDYILSVLTNNLDADTIIIIDELDKYINSLCNNDEENAQKINESILNSILSLIEMEAKGNYNVFLLFFSNNFNTIFSNISENSKIHYESFEDRFIQIKYNRIDKVEMIDYFQWLANLINTDFTFDTSKIPDDFTITFRKLTQSIISNNYDINLIIEKLLVNDVKQIVQPKIIKQVEVTKPVVKQPVVKQPVVKQPIIQQPVVKPLYNNTDPTIRGEKDFDNYEYSDEGANYAIEIFQTTKDSSRRANIVSYFVDNDKLEQIIPYLSQLDLDSFIEVIDKYLNMETRDIDPCCITYHVDNAIQLLKIKDGQLSQVNMSKILEFFLEIYSDILYIPVPVQEFLKNIDIKGYISFYDWLKIVRADYKKYKLSSNDLINLIQCEQYCKYYVRLIYYRIFNVKGDEQFTKLLAQFKTMCESYK